MEQRVKKNSLLRQPLFACLLAACVLVAWTQSTWAQNRDYSDMRLETTVLMVLNDADAIGAARSAVADINQVLGSSQPDSPLAFMPGSPPIPPIVFATFQKRHNIRDDAGDPIGMGLNEVMELGLVVWNRDQLRMEVLGLATVWTRDDIIDYNFSQGNIDDPADVKGTINAIINAFPERSLGGVRTDAEVSESWGVNGPPGRAYFVLRYLQSNPENIPSTDVGCAFATPSFFRPGGHPEKVYALHRRGTRYAPMDTPGDLLKLSLDLELTNPRLAQIFDKDSYVVYQVVESFVEFWLEKLP